MFKVLHSAYFSDTYPEEWAAMTASLSSEQLVSETRTFSSGDIILPRYMTVPFGDLLESEVQASGAKLINSYQESSRVRDIFHWTPLLGELTAPSYHMDELSSVPEGGFFVKGQTSSLKNRGASSVFATNKSEALALAQGITQDPWLSGETPVIRPLQDYLRLGTTPTGLPIFHERRVFTYKGQVLAQGFYWQSFLDCLKTPVPEVDHSFWQAVEVACARVSSVAPFLVIDMAQYSNGSWGVVELNDGCQAGVSGGVELSLYQGLASLVN